MALALGQARAEVPSPPSTALDGVWTILALEVNGRPATLTDSDRSLPIRNNTFTLPGVAAVQGTMRIDLGPQGTLRAVPAAIGTGDRRDPTRGAPGTAPSGANLPGTSGTGVVGGARGVYVRTADFLVLTIGDPSAATATGTGVGPTTENRPVPSPGATPGAVPPTPAVGTGTLGTVGQPPVSVVLRRSTGVDAPPATAAPLPPATPAPAAPALQRMSSVIGSNVTLSDGSPAGRIADVVYGAGGAVDYVALDNNGVFAAVPWGALSWGAGGVVSLPLTRNQFGTIPTFAARDWSNVLANRDFSQRLQTTFGNFRGANGQPIFNQLGNNVPNRMGNRAGGQPGMQLGAQPKTQPKIPPGGGGGGGLIVGAFFHTSRGGCTGQFAWRGRAGKMHFSLCDNPFVFASPLRRQGVASVGG
jgi:hypothetical protein